jgi:hypothetical protein
MLVPILQNARNNNKVSPAPPDNSPMIVATAVLSGPESREEEKNINSLLVIN